MIDKLNFKGGALMETHGLIGIAINVTAFFVMLAWLWVTRDKDYKPSKAGTIRQRKSKIPTKFELL